MNNTPSEFKVPISNIYLLNNAGIPLFARFYQGYTGEADSVLFAGFLSAIEIFTRTNLGSKLTDIGLDDGTRYFFDRSSHGYMTVIAMPSSTKFYIDPLQVKIIKQILDKMNITITILIQTAESHGIKVNILAENLGNLVDSILLESALEFTTEIEIKDDTSYIPKNFEKGKKIDTSEFSDLIDNIGKKVKEFLK